MTLDKLINGIVFDSINFSTSISGANVMTFMTQKQLLVNKVKISEKIMFSFK